MTFGDFGFTAKTEPTIQEEKKPDPPKPAPIDFSGSGGFPSFPIAPLETQKKEEPS